MRTGTIEIHSGIGKASGKPYTQLKLNVGKWNGFLFPTQFEIGYLKDYLKDGQTGTITLGKTERKELNLSAGDYTHVYVVESNLEYKYIQSFLSSNPTPSTDTQSHDATLDLETEDPIQEGFNL